MSRAKPKKVIPTFANEDEERAFWDSHDWDDYFAGTWDQVFIPDPDFIRHQKAPKWLKILLDQETMARLCEAAIEEGGVSHHELGRRWIRERLDQKSPSLAK